MSQINFRNIFVATLVGCFILSTGPTFAKNQMGDYAATPPFVSFSEKPALMLIFDNSGSMHEFAQQERIVTYNTSYHAATGYVPSNTYYGYFNSNAYYSYDTSKRYFYVSSTGNWNGNFLNWLMMKRIDVAKKVLTGGMTDTASDGSTCLVGAKPDNGTNDRGEYKVYNDTNTVTDLSGASKHMSPFSQRWVMQINTSFDTTVPDAPAVYFYGATTSREGQSTESWSKSGTTALGSSPYYMRVKPDTTPNGIVQSAGDKVRFGLTIYNSSNEGGIVKQPIGAGTTNIVSTINGVYPNTNTPLSETLYTVIRYFAQKSTYYGSGEYTISNAWDPFYFADRGKLVPCSKAFVIIITDGEPTEDLNIPNSKGDLPNDNNLRDYNGDKLDPGSYASNGSDYLDDVALYAHNNDLRTETAMPSTQNLTIYAIQAFGGGSDLLKRTAINGGYVDINGTGRPNTPAQEAAADANHKEWDFDGDGMPDNYAGAASGQELENAILNAISSILARVSSGTAASVISNTRSGEGAVYQAVFYPQFEDGNLNKVQWAGEIHALMLDSFGNMREDTNGDGVLDLVNDLIITYNVLSDGTVQVRKYQDVNGNGFLDGTEGNSPVTVTGLTGIKYLWNTSNWLNEITDADVVTQRDYTSTDKKRYIFTTVDANKDGIPDSTLPFVCASDPGTDLTDTSKFYAYLNTHTPFTSPTLMGSPWSIKSTDVLAFRKRQIKREVEYIRGKDQGQDTTVGTSTIPAFRSRKVDYTGGAGTPKTWRLGDIIYSTPTVVSNPAEDFDLLYRDGSYSTFFAKYKNRRSVIYAGANDGMLHAFNGGFYNKTNKSFVKKLTSETEFDLGAELWAYVPFNLLPHLYWLTDPNYPHVYYVDLKPRIFDARIFAGQDDGATGTHPGGWGTVMVCGMRLGGGAINADVNKNDTLDGTDPNLRSAYIVMDITNPEAPPRVLAEFSFAELGFTTSYPTVYLSSQKDASGNVTGQKWYLVLGSGPIDETDGAGSAAMTAFTSTKSAKIYMVDLAKLADVSPSTPAVSVIDSTRTVKNATFGAGADYLVSLDTKSFISDLVAVDFDLDYNADAIYFGTVQGNLTDDWGGKLRRLVFDDGKTTKVIKPDTPSTWITDSTLIDLTGVHQPITAAPALASDGTNFWVLFGTGRFFNRDDATGSRASEVESFYGIKEPTSSSIRTWGTVTAANLLNVSNATVFDTGATVTGVGSTSFSALMSAVAGKQGWYMNFLGSGERNIGQAAILGDIVTFTSYTPSSDFCTYEGNSTLYGLYYKTGTAFSSSVLGLNTANTNNEKAEVVKSISLGRGLSVTPNLNTGQGEGSKAFVQQSTGGIQNIQQNNPGITKSRFLSWEEE